MSYINNLIFRLILLLRTPFEISFSQMALPLSSRNRDPVPGNPEYFSKTGE